MAKPNDRDNRARERSKPKKGAGRYHERREIPDAERKRMIAEAAYFRFERRGSEPGHDLDDWLAARAKIDARLGRDKDTNKDTNKDKNKN